MAAHARRHPVIVVAAALVVITAACATTRRERAVLESLRRSATVFAWRGEQQRIGYANIEKLTATSRIERGPLVRVLPSARGDFSRFVYAWQGSTRSIDEFMTSLNVVGLLVIKDGRIVLERYARGHSVGRRWTSFSVAKSVTSLLFGAAVMDGFVRLDDGVTKYVPQLSGTAYDDVTVRQLLQMSSGVRWSENPADPASDVSQLARLNQEGGFAAELAYLTKLPRRAPAGTVFNYNTAETDVAGAILRAATGQTLSRYLSEKIWRPFGMEADGHWITMRGSDLERGGCCISATLRDYGRIGLLALNDGVSARGTRLLPVGWMQESTRPSPASKGYGYYWWLRRNGRYFASGSFGQHIEVAPADRIVVAVQSYWPAAFNDELIGHNDAFVGAIIDAAVRMR
jgi:CubicO group peptidase (beta-lactamase class C family)